MSLSPGVRSSNRVRTAPPSQAAQPAQAAQPVRLGSWELIEQIGAGEFTAVFLARPLAQPVPAGRGDYALKILKPMHEGDPRAIAMMQREAFVAERVRHVHLASVLACRVLVRPFYLVMPLLRGATARQGLQAAGRLAPPHALWIVRQAAEALGALHQAGWRHGDVKPENLLVGTNGHVTLIDLGMADPLDGHAPHNVIKGSPAYWPPEAFHTRPRLHAASDVYSLGVTLFELLTGRRPFPEGDLAELAEAHLSRPAPDPRGIVPSLPVHLARFVRVLLAKEPLRRPAGDELIGQLVDLEIDTLDARVPA